MIKKQKSLWNRLLPELIAAYKKSSRNIQYKENRKVLTQVDISLSHFIKKYLKENLSTDYTIISEESFKKGQVPGKKTAFIDPIDNTISLISGYTDHTISVGLKEYDTFTSGFVYVPETNEIYIGDIETNATCNQKPVSPFTGNINQRLRAIGTCTFVNNMNITKIQAVYRQLLQKKIPIRITGGAALQICEVACGKLFGYISFGAHLWDIAGALAILSSAGGAYKLFSYNPSRLSIGFIAAGSTRNLKVLEEMIDKEFDK